MEFIFFHQYSSSMKNLTVTGFEKYDVEGLLAKAKHIVSQMTINVSHFTAPKPTLAVVQDAIDNLDSAEAEAATNDTLKKAIRNDKKVALIDLLEQLAVFVDSVALGQRTLVLLSGFDVRKVREPRILQPVTTAPRALRTPVAGKVKASIRLQKGANGTVWYGSEDNTKPLNEWAKYDNKGARCTFENVPPGRQYYICVELLGSRQQTQMSPQAVVIV